MKVASETAQPTSLCQNSFLTNRHVQITLFVIGILGMVLGSYYLQGIPRIVTVAAGALVFALFVISKCLGSCSANSNAPEMDVAPAKKSNPAAEPAPTPKPAKKSAPVPEQPAPQPAPAKTTTPPVAPQKSFEEGGYRRKKVKEHELQADKLGAALLNALKTNRKGIKNASMTYSINSDKPSYEQGYRLDFQADTGDAFSFVLAPEIYSNDPNTIKWCAKCLGGFVDTGQEERLSKAIATLLPGQKFNLDFFIGVIEERFPQFHLKEIPAGSIAFNPALLFPLLFQGETRKQKNANSA